MTDRELFEQALEALENPWKAGPDGVANAITALRERLAQPVQKQHANTITFNRSSLEGSAEMLRLDSKGFHYNGQVIEDAGEAHRLFMQWLATANAEQPEQEHIIDCPRCGHCCPQQPVQEPVAEVKLKMTGGNAGIATHIVEIYDPLRDRLHPGTKLYTAPPRREWLGLTLDEKKRLNDALNLQGRFPVIDAIETKLKEKNT